ncbi:hypothetical protein [Massilia frigida]|uniref:hypothetical protein n=1 Tax=Massilia frigida TaxID=2609281 RepID=UPI001420B3E0|nr:hypothetical protein [Massilia frigida]
MPENEPAPVAPPAPPETAPPASAQADPDGPPVLSGIAAQERVPAGGWIGAAVAWGGSVAALAALVGAGFWFYSERKVDDAMHALAMSAKIEPVAPAGPAFKATPPAVVPLTATEPPPDNTAPPPGRITPAPEAVPPLVVLPPEPEKPGAPAVKKPLEPAPAPKPVPVPKPAHPLAATVAKNAHAAKHVIKARTPVIAAKKPVAHPKAPVAPIKPGAKKSAAPVAAKAGAKKKPVAVAPVKPGVKPKVAPKPVAKPAPKAKPVAKHEPAFRLHTPATAKPCKSGALAREC